MHILHLLSSPRGAASVSTQLGLAVVEQLLAANPNSTVTTRNLATRPVPHLEERHILSFYVPAAQRSPELVEAVKPSDEALAELLAADTLVLAAPMYNYTITSTLKSWLDHITRADITFRHDAQGITGLLPHKKVYVATASGGAYREGPEKAHDFVEPYLRTVLGFLGLKDVTFFRVEGLAVTSLKAHALDKAIASIRL